MKEILEFIRRRFPNDSNWLNGNCYHFACILRDVFDGEIYYDVIYDHFVTKCGGIYYDWSGVYNKDDMFLVNWSNFDDCDHLLKKRVIRNCVM